MYLYWQKSHYCSKFFQNKPKAVTATEKTKQYFVKQTCSKGKCEYKLKSRLAPGKIREYGC